MERSRSRGYVADGEEDGGEHGVHEDAGEHDDEALPARGGGERGIGGLLLEETDEAADGQPVDGVLGLALLR
jgi:hypothetical protein